MTTVFMREAIGRVPLGADGRKVIEARWGADGRPYLYLEGSGERFYGLVNNDGLVVVR